VGFTIWGYAFIGPRGRIVPGRIDQHMTDFTVFTEAGAAFFDGRDPYQVANPRGWQYMYPPLFALLVAPLSLVGTEAQVLIWYFINVGLTFACVSEARRLFRLVAPRVEPRSARMVATCAGLATLLPILDCMEAGQLGIGILYLLLVGFRLTIQMQSWRGSFLGGVVLALPAVVKLVPSLPVVFLLIQQWSAVAFPVGGRRQWGRTMNLTAGVITGAALFVLAIPGAVVGWQKNLDYLQVWHARVVANERVGPNLNFNIHSFRNQSLANAVYMYFKATSRTAASDGPTLARPDRPERFVHPGVRVVIAMILTLLLAVALIVRRSSDYLDQATGFGLACCATLLVSPLSWGHYFMVQLPAALCVPVWCLRRGLPKLAMTVATIPPVLSWSYYVAMPITGAHGLLGLGTTAWFLGACGLILGIEVLAVLAASKIVPLIRSLVQPAPWPNLAAEASAIRPKLQITWRRKSLANKRLHLHVRRNRPIGSPTGLENERV
jgi:hypothetical protein